MVDAFWWSEGPASLRTATRSIVHTWRRAFPNDELILLLRRHHRVPADLPEGVIGAVSSIYPQAAFATVGTQIAATRYKPDFVFTHNYANPFHKSAVMIHDLLFESNPEWFTRTERVYFAPMRPLARFADVVFSTSSTECARFAKFGIENAVPVGLGLGEELFQAIPEEPTHLGLRSHSFLLTVGRINVRKNLRRTIEGSLRSNVINPDFPLIVVGSGDGPQVDLEPFAGQIENGTIRITPSVDVSALAWLYSHTAAFLYLSLGEGYGLPPIEARHFGATVIVSDLEIFHETMGDGAVFVNPLDVREISLAISLALKPMPHHIPRFTGREHSWMSTVGHMRDALSLSLQTST